MLIFLTFGTVSYFNNGYGVLELAAELGIPAEEGMIYQEELPRFDELFLSGTTTEVMPIVSVDGREVVDGEPGPVTRRLLEAYRAALPG